MASIPFTLAALATSAVPGLEVTAVRVHDVDAGFAAALLSTDRGDLVTRVPRTQASEVRQSAEILGIAALTEGSRAVLPFAIPETLGITRAGETRAVVSTMLPGERFDVEDLTEDAALLTSIIETIAAIHDLPLSVAQQGGLPIRSARDLRLQATRLVDRATATRLLPGTVRAKWERVLESAELWDFAPTMVHGSLDANALLVDDEQVVGVEGWSEFSVGDPADDLAWLLAAGPEILDTVVPRYGRRRSAGSLPALQARAQLYHELGIARWLLHGVETHDQTIIDEAIAMLDRFVDRIATSPPIAPTASVLDAEGVEALLEETPEVVDHLSDTAAYEALDEDRMFGVEPDFVQSSSDSAEDRVEGATKTPEQTAEQIAEEISEQATVPIDEEDLPR